MGLDGPVLILIAAVVLLMFGGKKIPELMKGLGKGVKEFKDATNGESTTNTPVPTNTEEKPKVSEAANL
jgi:sec-independent protein translocase protein TatA